MSATVPRTFCATTGKLRYENRGIAIAALRAVNRKRHRQHPYHCKVCGGWHLGSRMLGSGHERPRTMR